MNKNLLIILILAIVISAGVLAVTFMGDDERTKPPKDDESGQRIVCLTPSITETVFAIGAGDNVVGISDWSSYPPEAKNLPTLGTSLTPQLEAIRKHEPTLILADNSKGARKKQISGLGDAHFLDWLTLQNVIDSTRKLGELTGQKDEAEKLAVRYEALLATPEALNPPKVLMVIAGSASKLGPIHYIRRNSFHGAMLRAAGGKNAVNEDVAATDTASMSIERIIELQPEVILILSSDGEMTQAVKDAHLAEWTKLKTLHAVKGNRVSVIAIDGLTLPNPRVFENIPKVKKVLEELYK
ncbi:MAG: helical backbone metal receptor [Planctomycetes bacterium]|nr:helical backbone metal receptor [Planctomycetota bacterium]